MNLFRTCTIILAVSCSISCSRSSSSSSNQASNEHPNQVSIEDPTGRFEGSPSTSDLDMMVPLDELSDVGWPKGIKWGRS